MELTWQMLLIVCPLIFLAGFVDSVAGGGGLISLPAYYLVGLDPLVAAGTNKLSACLGTIAASGSYVFGRKVYVRIGLLAALLALPGSWLGATIQQQIPANIVRIMMICMIPVVAVVVLGNRSAFAGVRRVKEEAVLPMCAVIGFGIGFYDGLVGPGTGTFLIILFTMLLGMETVMASGTAKIVNLASNIAALTTYIASGRVMFALGIPAAICAIAGNMLGARMTMKRGTGFIRSMLIVVLALLLAKMVYDVVI